MIPSISIIDRSTLRFRHQLSANPHVFRYQVWKPNQYGQITLYQISSWQKKIKQWSWIMSFTKVCAEHEWEHEYPWIFRFLRNLGLNSRVFGAREGVFCRDLLFGLGITYIWRMTPLALAPISIHHTTSSCRKENISKCLDSQSDWHCDDSH